MPRCFLCSSGSFFSYLYSIEGLKTFPPPCSNSFPIKFTIWIKMVWDMFRKIFIVSVFVGAHFYAISSTDMWKWNPFSFQWIQFFISYVFISNSNSKESFFPLPFTAEINLLFRAWLIQILPINLQNLLWFTSIVTRLMHFQNRYILHAVSMLSSYDAIILTHWYNIVYAKFGVLVQYHNELEELENRHIFRRNLSIS